MAEYKERHKAGGGEVTYRVGDQGLERFSAPARAGRGLLGTVRQVFLPDGYPHTVSKDYLEYQVWDTLQAFASSVTGSLATAAVLEGVGVGDAAATPLAATLTWILKDGAGMVGRILFAALVGTSLDHDCKRWRMFADITNDLVMLIELLARFLPRPLVLPVLCLAGVGRSLVGVAGGATKAAVAQHQALNSNMADLAAKDGSQETLVNLVALCLNLVLLPLVSGDLWLTGCLFVILTLLHIYANYRAVSCLVFSTLNSARLKIAVDCWRKNGKVLQPEEANRLEPVFLPTGLNLRLGVSLSELQPGEVGQLVEGGCTLLRGKGSVRVVVGQGAHPKDIYKAAASALLEGKEQGLVDQLEDAGWDLSILALHTHGYTYTSNS